MRDWYLPIAPVAAITYFIAFPSQFNALLSWAGRMIQWSARLIH